MRVAKDEIVSITDSMDRNLSKLLEVVEGREDGVLQSMGVSKN